MSLVVSEPRVLCRLFVVIAGTRETGLPDQIYSFISSAFGEVDLDFDSVADVILYRSSSPSILLLLSLSPLSPLHSLLSSPRTLICHVQWPRARAVEYLLQRADRDAARGAFACARLE